MTTMLGRAGTGTAISTKGSLRVGSDTQIDPTTQSINSPGIGERSPKIRKPELKDEVARIK